MRPTWLIVAALLTGCSTGASQAGAAPPKAPPSAAPDGFWEHWGDGQAELAGYALTMPRYGEARQGEAVLVFVTESLDPDSLVKPDRPRDGTIPVVKLNDSRDFQTGVYDYNVMTSTFVPLDGSLPRGVPTKIAFSSQEWCGHVYDQYRIRPDGVTHTWHSYFEGEEDGTEELTTPRGAVYGDAAHILARDLAGEWVAPGESREVRYYPRTVRTRFLHQDADFVEATLAREADSREVTVPAGTFEVRRTTLTVGERVGSWDVEVAPPHRLVAWSWSDGERGELTGAERMPYWNLHDNGQEALRTRLGLGVRPLAPRGSNPVENSGD